MSAHTSAQTPSQAPPRPGVDPAVIADLVAANHALVDNGILDAFGHVSVRNPNNPDHYFMARSGDVAPTYVTAADIMEYDLDSNAVGGGGHGMHSERYIHGQIYKARPDVKAVVHSHARGVIPFSVSKVPLRAIFHNAAFLGDGVPVFEIRDVAGENNGMLVNTNAIAKGLADTLGQYPVALMRGHGDVVVGPDLPTAVFRAIYTDVNAALQLQAATLGGPITFLNAYEAKKPQVMERAWASWKRRAQELRRGAGN